MCASTIFFCASQMPYVCVNLSYYRFFFEEIASFWLYLAIFYVQKKKLKNAGVNLFRILRKTAMFAFFLGYLLRSEYMWRHVPQFSIFWPIEKKVLNMKRKKNYYRLKSHKEALLIWKKKYKMSISMIIALRKECDVLDVATDGEWGNKTHFYGSSFSV